MLFRLNNIIQNNSYNITQIARLNFIFF